MNNDDDGKQVTCYDIQVNGLFGRNRKVKTELFSLAKHLDTPLTLDQVKSLMDAKLSSLKLKGAYKYRLIERIGRVKNEGGFEIYTSLFGDRKELLSGTGN